MLVLANFEFTVFTEMELEFSFDSCSSFDPLVDALVNVTYIERLCPAILEGFTINIQRQFEFPADLVLLVLKLQQELCSHQVLLPLRDGPVCCIAMCK